MPRKEKEEDRIERIIRGLLKESGNRRCINCNCLGPQYVCTTFWTFICTSCSGVHREFSHRVKSVSMAKFNVEEISCLQTGGNERAREIYFKTWDAQRNSHPDSSNLHKLREFIKHVYVDRKYAGQNNHQTHDQRNDTIELRRVQTLTFGVRDEIRERHSFERYSSSVREENERRSLDKPSPSTPNDGRSFRNMFEERRSSPRHIQENQRSSVQKNRPTRFEIVDDRFREDGRTKVFDRYSSSKEARPRSRSPGSQSTGKTNLPALKPVTDILGDKGPVLKVGEPPRAHDGKDAQSSEQLAKKAANNKPASVTEKQNQDKIVNFASFIDFDYNPEPSCATTNTQEPAKAFNTNTQSSSAPSSAPGKDDNDRTINSLESLWFDWPDPTTSSAVGASQTSDVAQASLALTSTPPNNLEAPDVAPQGALVVSTGDVNPSITTSEKDQTLPRNSSDSMALVTESPASNVSSQAPSVRLEESSQAAGNAGETSKTGGRKEIPADLFFAPNFTGYNPGAPGFQMRPPHAMGYGMHFHPPVMSTNGFQNRTKASNPFDFGDGGLQAEAAPLPSMSPLQGALPHLRAATQLQPQTSPYGTSLFPNVSPYGMNMTPVPGAYMGSQPNNVLVPRPQGTAGLNRDQEAFRYLNPSQQQGMGTDSSSPAPNSSFSRGNNPFA